MFSRLAHPSLVHDEHFVSKYFFFYKVARLTNSEARQACLEEREKKRQEETLRQALAASHLTSSSIVRPLS